MKRERGWEAGKCSKMASDCGEQCLFAFYCLSFLQRISVSAFLNTFFGVRSASTIGGRGIGAPLVLADYKLDDCVWLASPIFKPTAY
jgi:hypothetical protein